MFDENQTADALLRAFMKFRRINWYESKSLHLKPSDIRVLFCIRRGQRADGEGMKVSDISQSLDVSPPTVTQLLVGLEKSGLIARHSDPVDRRVTRVTMTELGESTVRKAREEMSASMNGLVSFLGEDKSQRLIELLGEVRAYYLSGAECARKEGDE